MIDHLPKDASQVLDWSVEQYQPFFEALISREINAGNVQEWLEDWSDVARLVEEAFARIYMATSVDTTDEVAEKRFIYFNSNVLPAVLTASNMLNQKLVQSGLQPEGFEIPLRNMKADIELFREENLPLITELSNLGLEYDKAVGAQTVEWEGQELTLAQMMPIMLEGDRPTRERAWRASMERALKDRETLNTLWTKMLKLRIQIAKNAGFDSYLDYRWKELKRFDYTPANSVEFQNAIEQVVVPAAARLYDRHRQQLGYDSLRPWDEEWRFNIDPQGRTPLKPYQKADELESKTHAIFSKVDPALGNHFEAMRSAKLLDLDNRKGKAPGGYCMTLPLIRKPFIFMNGVGMHDDVQTMLHEGGHAFHVFESAHLPLIHQEAVPMEFAEVASMAMELLAAPYLAADEGGFYSEADAARARIEHLEGMIKFWPYMAVVDAFQHWVYTNTEAALDPANCDAKWSELWARFMVGVDYSGLEDIVATGWHRKLHIFHLPFYYVEYGLAQLGSVQVWANALKDQAQSVANYRKALALGGTVTLPELYAAAGAKFAFDAQTLQKAVDLVENTIDSLEAI